MALPIGGLPTSALTIAGVEVEYRSLSRAEAIRLQDFRSRPDDAERWILACGTGVTEDGAEAFRAGNTLAEAGRLIDAILELSGLTKLDEESESDGGPKVPPSSSDSSESL